jgi:hypothetical protein
VLQITEDKRNVTMFSNESITVNMFNLFNRQQQQQQQQQTQLPPILAASSHRNSLLVPDDTDQTRKTSTDHSVDLVTKLSSILSTNGKMSAVIICHFDFSINQFHDQPEETPIQIQSLPPKGSIMKQPPNGVKNSQSSASISNMPRMATDRRNNFYRNRKYNLSYDLGYASAQNRKSMNNADYESFSTSFYNDDTSNLNNAASSSNSILDLRSLIGVKSTDVKVKKLRKSDISSPVSFNHVTHLDKPVAIGKRYKVNY